jgi:hypothetical protein
MNRSKKQTDLAPRSRRQAKSDLLTTPADHLLTHKEDLWEKRRKQAARGPKPQRKFVPKFEQRAEPEYDGYSRRDRHHVTPRASVRSEKHVENIDEELSASSVGLGRGVRPSTRATKH